MPIFTLDTNPVQEADGKFTVNIPDNMAVEASKYNTLNTQHTELSTTANDYKSKLDSWGDRTPEAYDDMQTQFNAYKEQGNPDDLKLELSKFKQENDLLKGKFDGISEKYNKQQSYINNDKITKALVSEAKKR